jgi:hypothetical protein
MESATPTKDQIRNPASFDAMRRFTGPRHHFRGGWAASDMTARLLCKNRRRRRRPKALVFLWIEMRSFIMVTLIMLPMVLIDVLLLIEAVSITRHPYF